jgi:hypothetical protein
MVSLQFPTLADATLTRQAGPKTPPADGQLAIRHRRLGWWSIAIFGALGLILETFHGFKVGAYLDVSNETRRLMWTLAHAHGTLLGLVHLGFASTISASDREGSRTRPSSSALTAASVALPGGFFLGGVQFSAGDPGIGIVLVPVGAALLIFAAVSTARDL